MAPPPQAAHMSMSALLQPWPGVTDSPMWFHSRRYIYIYIYIYTVLSLSVLPAGHNVWKTV